MKTFTIATFALALGASHAHAGFFGSEMQADWRFPDFNSTIETFNFIVSNEIEIPFRDIRNAENMRIDVSDTSILIEVIDCDGCYFQTAEFNGWWFNDINNTIPRITGVTFEDSGNLDGLEQSDFGFDDNSVWGNFESVTPTSGDAFWIRFDVEFVPAPSAFALFGIAAFGMKRRRRE